MKPTLPAMVAIVFAACSCESSEPHAVGPTPERIAAADADADASPKPGADREEAAALAKQGDDLVHLDPNGAIEKYEAAVALDPRNHRILHKLAKAHRQREDWAKVEATLKRALAVAGSESRYWRELGLAQQMRASREEIPYEHCKTSYRTCLEHDPKAAGCHRLLASVLSDTGEDEAALPHYQAAVEAEPGDIKTHAQWAEALVRLGRVDDALRKVRLAEAQAQPSDTRMYFVHIAAAKAHRRKGDKDQEVQSLERANARSVGASHDVLLLLGRAYAEQTPPRTEEALELLKRFRTRACRGRAAKRHAEQCEEAKGLVEENEGA